MAYEGNFRIFVFPTITVDMTYFRPVDIQLGCHTLVQANIDLEKTLKEYPERRIWLIQGFTEIETTEYTEKVVAMA